MRLPPIPGLFLSLSLITSMPAFTQTVDRGFRASYPIIGAQGRVYVGTPAGLRYYDAVEDDWTVTVLPGGEGGNDVNVLGLHQGILWAGTRAGAANADIRLGDWMVYDTTTDLADNFILSLAFEEDYVWVGTEAGASRFDLLSQEWETYGQEHGLVRAVNDIAVDGSKVWFATDGGVVEYDAEFQTWRDHEEAPQPLSQGVESILLTTEYVWFFGLDGAGKFNKALRSWSLYTGEHGVREQVPNDLALEGDSVWMATEQGVVVYDPESDSWDDFPEERQLPSKDVRSIVLTGDEVWFGTAQGIARYNRETGNWRTYSSAEGLSSAQVTTLHLYGDILFATSEGAIDYLKLSEDRWYSVKVSSVELKKPGVLSLTDAGGALLQLSPQLGLSLKGRASYELETRETEPSPDTDTRTDLRLVAHLPGERTSYSFYNDTDPEGVQYGLKYRGRDDDLLREAELGDLRCEPGRSALIRPLGVYGGGAKLAWDGGPAAEKGTTIRFTGSAGERTTGFDTDLFVGRKRKHAIEVQDVAYLRRTHYRLDTTSTLVPLLPESERIWVDDRVVENNTPNTWENGEVGGAVGDFDLLVPGEDYYIDYEQGLVRFATARQTTDVIAVHCRFLGSGGGEWEGVIQDSLVEGFELLNRYSLGGAEIIPPTLSVRVVDLNGIEQSLSAFGLDGDLDGLVDPELVDFRKGVLHMLSVRPFPDQVYWPSNPTHLYTIQAEFETRSSLYSLSRTRLIRESEVVLIDGRPLRRGNDYVLDYTSGYLLVLDEELISERSDVQVSYEYWTQAGAEFGSAGTEVELGQNVKLGVRGVQFEEELTDTSHTKMNVLGASAELQFPLSGYQVRVPLELAQNTGPGTGGRAYRSEALFSSDRLQLRGLYQAWDDEFHSLLPRSSKLGSLTKRHLVSGEYHLRSYLPVSLAWTSQSSAPDDTAPGGVERNLQGSFLFTKENLPVVGISSGLTSTDTPLSSTRRTTLTGKFEYEIRKEVVPTLPLRSLRLTSYLSRTWEDVDASQGPTEESIFDAGLLRLRASPVRDVEVGSWYRYRLNRILNVEPVQIEPTFASKELTILSRCDRVRGLSLYLRGEASVTEGYLPEREGARDVSLDGRRECALEVYPGRWASSLNLLSLDLGWSSTWKAHLPNFKRSLALGEALWTEFPREEVISHSRLTQRAVSGELRPGPVLSLSSGYQRLTDEQGELETTLERLTHVYSNRLEVRPRFRSVVTTELNIEEEHTTGVRKRVRTLPIFRWEERWWESFLSKLSLVFSRESSDEEKIVTRTTSVTPGLGLTLRRDRLWLLGGVDLNEDLSVTWLKSRTWTGETSTRKYSSQLRVELRPLKVVKLRTRLALAYETDSTRPDRGALSSTISFRLSAQF